MGAQRPFDKQGAMFLEGRSLRSLWDEKKQRS